MLNEQLVMEIQAGRDIREHMTELWQQNQGLIHKAADYYPARYREDLVQQAFFGLANAARLYKPELGTFSTYAYRWIKQSMTRYMENSAHVIRVPSYIARKVRRYRKAKADFERDNGRTPSGPELCAFLEITPAELDTVKAAAEMQITASLDSPVQQEEGETALRDVIADPFDLEGEVAGTIFAGELSAAVWAEVANLPPEEREVIESRYRQDEPIKSIAARTGKTERGCRTIHDRALRLMRRNGADALKGLAAGDETRYSAGIRGTGVNSFNHTWTSATERAALNFVGNHNPEA